MSASPEPRVSAAAALLSRLKNLAPVLKQMELICDGNFLIKRGIKFRFLICNYLKIGRYVEHRIQYDKKEN